MMRMQPRPSHVQFNNLLSDVARMRHYPVALHLFDEMLHWNAPVDHYTFNIVIDSLCSLRRADVGLATLGTLSKLGYGPNVITLSTLVKGFCKMGRVNEALELFVQFKAAGKG